MKRLRALVAVALIWGAVQSCEQPIGPLPGALSVVLATPHGGADGAILFTLTGPAPVTSVTPGPGLRLFAQPFDTTTRFALTGAVTQGTVVTIGVTDVRQVGSYTATLQQVAAPSFELRPLAGYALRVSR